MTKAQRTREHIQRMATELFELRGYDTTTVAQIAAAAGVTEMTVYRHFAAKDRIILDDPYDEAIAEAVAAQSTGGALDRVVAGLRTSWRRMPAAEVPAIRRRLRIAASSESLRAAVAANTAETERVAAAALERAGVPEREARIAAAAALAATMRALLDWSRTDDDDLDGALEAAWTVLADRA